MASAFDTAFAAGSWPILAAQFGESATYHPITGDSVSLTAALGPIELAEHQESDGLMREYERDAVIAISDVASPAMGAEVQIGSDRWAIVSIIETGAVARLRLSRAIPAERSRDGYRGDMYRRRYR